MASWQPAHRSPTSRVEQPRSLLDRIRQQVPVGLVDQLDARSNPTGESEQRDANVCHFARCDEFDTSCVLPVNDTAVGASYRVANDTGKRR